MNKNTAMFLFCLSLVLADCLSCGGCVERRLAINTNPSGAQVLLNDEDIGVSPVTTTFKWYGNYNITIRKAGCETLNTHQKLNPPWYDYFPFDFFAQVLYPGRIVDSYQWSFNLKPSTEPSRDKLINEAEQLKQKAEN
ncbi:MAG: PEGA domain-containing protein [Sedimentisphaerales bacterium]